MKKPSIPMHTQKILAEERRLWCKQLEKKGFKRSELAWVCNVSKVRMSQILKK